MANDTLVILSKGGAKEIQLPISQIIIPDLWHIADALRTTCKVSDGPGSAHLILKCWNLTHFFKNHIVAL